MNVKALAILVFFIINFKTCQGIKYTKFSLITATPENKDQLKFLMSLDIEKYLNVIFWDKPVKTGRPVQFVLGPEDKALFDERADHFQLKYSVKMDDIERAFNNQFVAKYQSGRPETYSFDSYHTLEDIYQWLTDLNRNRDYSPFVSYHSIGKSYEGREILVASIDINPGSQKSKVLIEGGIHGHEWASVVFVTYLINELARAKHSADSSWTKLAMDYEWLLLPIANPDGYDFTHRQDRLWRKNRNMTAGSIGVDLNRNFDESFGKFGSSSKPISDNYCGPKPFSESESKSLSSYISLFHKEIKYYFSIHAYGQKILIPYDDRVQHLENFAEMENYGRQAVHKLYLRNHIKYATGTSYDTMGTRNSGTSASWAKRNHKIEYVYTLLLRDNGTYGFALPCDQLIPMCEESKVMIQKLMTAKPRYIRALYEDDANVDAPCALLTVLSLFLTMK